VVGIESFVCKRKIMLLHYFLLAARNFRRRAFFSANISA